MDIVNLAKNLANTIDKSSFAGKYYNEAALEKDVYSVFRKALGKKLYLKGAGLDEKVITHGETKEEKKRWSATKVWQNVAIAGCNNTADIVVRLSNKETIAIQLKYAKGNITGPVQTIIGQCIIGSLRHAAVIGLVFAKKRIKYNKEDKLKRLVNMLKKHNIFFVVKRIL